MQMKAGEVRTSPDYPTKKAKEAGKVRSRNRRCYLGQVRAENLFNLGCENIIRGDKTLPLFEQ